MKLQYICKICSINFKTNWALSKHIKIHNITKKDYYDTYIKTPDEGFCKFCGKPTEFINKISNGNKSCYKMCCNKDCFRNYMSLSSKSIERKEKIKNTLKTKYGEDVENVYQLSLVKEKIKNQNKEKFGVEYYYQTEEFKEKSKQTKKEKYGDENYTNREQAYITNENLHGDKFWNNPSKNIQTCLEKYGETNPMKVESIKKEFFKKYEDNTGYKTPFNNPEVIKKRQENYYKKTGYHYNSQNPEVHKKQMKCRFKAPNGKTYDSSWEYKFEQYLIENKIDYIYQSDKTFTWYDVKGESHEYIPDFYLIENNEFIEIKGDQFFDKNGNYKSPHDKTEEDFKNSKLKYECMVKNKVKILRRNDLKKLGIKLS